MKRNLRAVFFLMMAVAMLVAPLRAQVEVYDIVIMNGRIVDGSGNPWFPEDLADIPLVAAAHHERWNGTGYPDGLRGEEIPIGSRIVAVADAYDALTEERCYHEAWSPESAVEEIASRSGAYFDPAVVKAFLEYFKQEIEPRQRLLAARMEPRASESPVLSG